MINSTIMLRLATLNPLVVIFAKSAIEYVNYLYHPEPGAPFVINMNVVLGLGIRC